MLICKILGENRDHFQHQRHTPDRTGINIRVAVFLMQLPEWFGGFLIFYCWWFGVSFFSKSTKEGSEGKQKLSACGTGAEGKTENSGRQTEGVLLLTAPPALRNQTWPPARTKPKRHSHCLPNPTPCLSFSLWKHQESASRLFGN